MWRNDDVAVEHCGINAVAKKRLQCDLGREGWLFDGFKNASASPDCFVLRKAAASLAHEPNRGMPMFVTVRCSEER